MTFATVRMGLLLLAVWLLSAGVATAQSWELRVCAAPDNLPFSNDELQGFENRIAGIIAEELDASLSYEWLPRPTARNRDLYLRSGRCDVVMGVSDGLDGYLTTLSYYRSSFVFVYRSDSGLNPSSFDDPRLSELTIAVNGGGRTGPERLVLVAQGLASNLVTYTPNRDSAVPYSGPIDAVARKEADVAVVWGPLASYAASRYPGELEVTVAEPYVGSAFLPTVIPIAMGVRPHDEALRDLLNRALAGSWDRVQAVLDEFGVPLQPLPQPMLGESIPNTESIGFIVPAPSGSEPLEPEAPWRAARAAVRGAILADEMGWTVMESDLQVLVANAPSPAAARRAAQRMIAAHDAYAVVGGFGETQALVLSRVANELDTLFLNIASSDLGGQEAHLPTTFHMVPDSAGYLRALAGSLVEQGLLRWYLLHDDTEWGRLLEVQARRELADHPDATIVGSAALSESGNRTDLIREIQSAESDAVLLLLGWREQLEFQAFLASFDVEAMVTGMPDPSAQTRSFYLTAAPTMEAEEGNLRIALWDAGLAAHGAEELNLNYLQRWGEPMDPSAWAAFAAARVLSRAAEAAGTTDASELVAFLESDGAEFDLAKGDALRFDAGSHRLVQPLYLIGIGSETVDGEADVEVVEVIAPPASD